MGGRRGAAGSAAGVITGIACVTMAACGDGDTPPTAGPVVRDSAGVEIVDHTAPRRANADAWTLAPDPARPLDTQGADDPNLHAPAAATPTRRVEPPTLAHC